jgi:hypothetical protein
MPSFLALVHLCHQEFHLPGPASGRWKKSIFCTNNPGIEEHVSELSLPAVQDRIDRWLKVNGYSSSKDQDEYSYFIEKCLPIADDRRRFFEPWIRKARPHNSIKLPDGFGRHIQHRGIEVPEQTLRFSDKTLSVATDTLPLRGLANMGHFDRSFASQSNECPIRIAVYMPTRRSSFSRTILGGAYESTIHDVESEKNTWFDTRESKTFIVYRSYFQVVVTSSGTRSLR